MTPVPPIRPAHGPADSLCFDHDSGGELVPRFSADAEGDAPLDDFHSVERSEVPPPERVLARRGKAGRWPSWTGLASGEGASAKQLARARAAWALAGDVADDSRQWHDMAAFCLGERLDISEVLRAVPARHGQTVSHPARLLQEGRLVALDVILPFLRRGAWGEHACMRWGQGIYFGGAEVSLPAGDGLWRGDDGILVRGAWRLGRAVGPCLWHSGTSTWKGPVSDAMLRQGHGRLTLSDGSWVSGTWEEGLLVGDALVAWPDGRRYYGSLVHEMPPMPHGQGRREDPDGGQTEGWFDFGVLNTRGTYTYPRGAALHGWRYRGPFVGGRKHGDGHVELIGSPQGRGGRPRHLAAAYRHDRLLANCPAGRLLAQPTDVLPDRPPRNHRR